MTDKNKNIISTWFGPAIVVGVVLSAVSFASTSSERLAKVETQVEDQQKQIDHVVKQVDKLVDFLINQKQGEQ